MRDITLYYGHFELSASLGISHHRREEIATEVAGLIENNGTLLSILTHFNRETHLTDAEWTTLCFSLGYYYGQHKAGNRIHFTLL